MRLDYLQELLGKATFAGKPSEDMMYIDDIWPPERWPHIWVKVTRASGDHHRRIHYLPRGKLEGYVKARELEG